MKSSYKLAVFEKQTGDLITMHVLSAKTDIGARRQANKLIKLYDLHSTITTVYRSSDSEGCGGFIDI